MGRGTAQGFPWDPRAPALTSDFGAGRDRAALTFVTSFFFFSVELAFFKFTYNAAGFPAPRLCKWKRLV